MTSIDLFHKEWQTIIYSIFDISFIWPCNIHELLEPFLSSSRNIDRGLNCVSQMWDSNPWPSVHQSAALTNWANTHTGDQLQGFLYPNTVVWKIYHILWHNITYIGIVL